MPIIEPDADGTEWLVIGFDPNEGELLLVPADTTIIRMPLGEDDLGDQTELPFGAPV